MDPVVSPPPARPPLAVAALGASARCRSQCRAPGLVSAEGRTTEWKSTALRTYHRRTKQADCRRLSCRINTRRVRRSLSAVPSGYGQLSPAEGKG
jgi:hypothetical protein